MTSPRKYALFCSANGNFGTLSLLIPWDKIQTCTTTKHPDDLSLSKIWSTLKDHAEHDVEFVNGNKTVTIDHLLTENYLSEIHDGELVGLSMVPSLYYNAISRLQHYAELRSPYDGIWYVSDNDKQWAGECIPGIASGTFDHIGAYLATRNTAAVHDQNNKEIDVEIVDGVLVLESRDEQLQIPHVRTVKDMFEKYYPEVSDLVQETDHARHTISRITLSEQQVSTTVGDVKQPSEFVLNDDEWPPLRSS